MMLPMVATFTAPMVYRLQLLQLLRSEHRRQLLVRALLDRMHLLAEVLRLAVLMALE